jgi:hypothetical protein
MEIDQSAEFANQAVQLEDLIKRVSEECKLVLACSRIRLGRGGAGSSMSVN